MQKELKIVKKYNIINDIELLKLQKKYRKGQIREEDLSKEQLCRLEELYKVQIAILDNAIENDKREIIRLKKKIGE